MKFNLSNPDPDNNKLVIEIDNLTKAQALAIEELMSVWQFINDKKFFYWTAFCIDGFLDWNMKIKVNGKNPERFMEDIGDRTGKIKIQQKDGTMLSEEMYFLDYLKIKNKLDEKEELIVDDNN